MTVQQLILLLRRQPPDSQVELRILVPYGDALPDAPPDIYVTQPTNVIPSRDHRGRTIVQVTNEL